MGTSSWSLNLLLLLAIMCWSVWGILDKKALEKASARDVFLTLILCELPQIPLLVLLMFNLESGWQLSWMLMVWTGLSSMMMTLSMLCYLTAMAKTEASYVLGITAAYPLVGQLWAVFWLGEPFVPTTVAGVLCICAGVFAIGLSREKNEDEELVKNKWFVLAAATLATICWGTYGAFDKMAVSLAGPFQVYTMEVFYNALFLIPAYFLFKRQGYVARLNQGRTWLFCALSAAALCLAEIAYLSALSEAPASYVVPITGCYPLIMYVLAVLILKERLSKARVLGIVLVVIGAMLVQLMA